MISRSWWLRRLSRIVWSAILVAGCGSDPRAVVTDPGQRLFLGYTKKEVNCARCHGLEGQGGNDGPNIQGVFQKYDRDTILDIIEYGKGEGEKQMPPFASHLTDEELQMLLRFVRSLQSDKSTQ